VTGSDPDAALAVVTGAPSTTSRRFRAVVVAYGLIIFCGISLAAATSDGLAGVAPIFVLAALFVCSEHRDRIFTDETGLSGSIAVALATALFVGERGWAGGAFVVCACGGLYWPQLRSREWSKVVVNAACFGTSGAIAAALVSAIISHDGSTSVLIAAALVATIAYWLANSVLLAVATTTLRGGPLLRNAGDLIKADTVMLVFAVGGALCGVVMTEVGPWVGILALAALLVALDVFVISVPAGPAALRAAWKLVATRVLAGLTAGIVAMIVAGGFSSPAAGAAVGIVAGLAAGFVVVLSFAAARLLGHGHRLDAVLVGGFVMAELPLPGIASVAGVFGALDGAAAAFIVASGLIIVASLLAAWRRRDNPKQFDDDVITAAVTQAMLDGLPDPDRRR
jgi:hypothetical protein